MPDRQELAAISLVLCTRNRASQLEQTLASLCNISFQRPWQLVIVNNGSTDNTQLVIDAFTKTAPNIEVVSVFEGTPGLAAARNAGVLIAKAPIVAFTDDDCYPAKNFLSKIYERFKSSEIGYSGGRVLLHDPADLPITIKESTTSQKLSPGILISSGQIIGANMAIRRNLLLELNGFDERLGAGTFFSSAEDTDILRRLSLHGETGYYDPEIVVSHHHGRRTQAQKKALLEGYSKGRGASMAKILVEYRWRWSFLKQWYWRLKLQPARYIVIEVGYALVFLVKQKFSRGSGYGRRAEDAVDGTSLGSS